MRLFVAVCSSLSDGEYKKILVSDKLFNRQKNRADSILWIQPFVVI